MGTTDKHNSEIRPLIDARLMFYRKAGISQYTRRLIFGMLSTGGVMPHILLDRREKDISWIPKSARIVRTITPAHHKWEYILLPMELRMIQARMGFHLLHSPDFVTVRGPWKKVITIHDLYFMHNARVMNNAGATYYARTAWSARAADAIIAVSRFTKADILRMIPGVDEAKITVVHEAADIAPETHAPPPAAAKYALFLGTMEPRKNIPTLLRALALAPAVQLRIAGASGWGDDDLRALAAQLGVAGRVIFDEQHLDDATRDAALRGARLLVMPSLYEGFGLPPLEAMARGVPVCCSNAGALPEIVGDAALQHDPLDAATLAAQMQQLWQNDALCAHQIQLGLHRAASFDWDKAAHETVAVYRKALDGRRTSSST